MEYQVSLTALVKILRSGLRSKKLCSEVMLEKPTFTFEYKITSRSY